MTTIFPSFEPVDLHPDLADHLIEGEQFQMIKHPLVFSVPHVYPLNDYVNKSYQAKLDAIAEAEQQGRFDQVVWLHERPYRATILVQQRTAMPLKKWLYLAGEVWIDSENVDQYRDTWDGIWRDVAATGQARHLMTPGERKVITNLPDLVSVYQGCTVERDDGWSWTLSRIKAKWFADRFARLEQTEPRLRELEVNRSDILAYFGRRGEKEVLIDPELTQELES